MPAARRKSSGPAARGAQSRLTFGSHSKITKPSIPSQTPKKDPALLEEVLARTPTPECSPQSTARLEEEAAERESEEVVKIARSKEEDEAAKLSGAKIKKYWEKIEDERKARRGP